MRIKITMNSPSGTKVELNYNYYIASMIYNLLEKSDSQYSKMLHDEGYMLGSRNFKLFTFSRLFPQRYKVEGYFLNIEGKTLLYISSPKNEFMLHLAEGLLASRKVSIGNSDFEIETVEILPEPEFKKEMKFICLSPVTTMTAQLVDGKRKAFPCIPGSDKFEENIRNNLLRKYHLLHDRLPDNLSLNIVFEDGDLKRYSKGSLIRYREMYIKGYSVPFTVRGSEELMKVGYDCGFGEKNSAGCGMVEVGNR